jgi:putative colanic acid biosynthesis acetyltransferase WcaF
VREHLNDTCADWRESGAATRDIKLLVDVRKCLSPHSRRNKIMRVLWAICYACLFRPTPRIMHGWRRFLLSLFGASMGNNARVDPSCWIWAPWNLKMGDYAYLSNHVDCYCVASIEIGAHATVSQRSFLCTASHDVDDPCMGLVMAPITIEDQAWVCAEVFVGPGVHIGQGAVAGARSSVFKNLPPWTVCTGSPATSVRKRIIRPDSRT